MGRTLVRGAWLVAVSACALALLLVGVAHLPFVRARVLNWARADISRRLSIVIEADELRYNLLTVSGELRNFSLSTPGEPPIIRADAVRVALGWRAVLRTVEVASLELVSPRVALVRHGDGRTNLPTTTSPGSPRSLEPIRLGIVSLRGMTLDALDEGTGHRGTAGPVDLSIDTRAERASAGAFGPSPVAVTIGGARGSAEGYTVVGTVGGRLGFDGARLSANAFRLDTPEARVVLDGWVDLIKEVANVEAHGRIETDLARSGALVGPAGTTLGGSAVADVWVRGTLADPSVHVVMLGRKLRYQSIAQVEASAEATFASGRLDIQRVEVRSDLGTVTIGGTLPITTAGAALGAGRLRGQVSGVDVDRVLDAAGVALPVRLGSIAAGDLDATLGAPTLFGANGWPQSNVSGAVRLAPGQAGLQLEGRLSLDLRGGRWSMAHTLQSASARTDLRGIVSGQLSATAGGSFDSTLLGRTHAHVDELHALIPFLEQAGVDLPSPIDALHGSADAVIDPRGTLAVPRAVASITGRSRHVPDFPEGDLDATVAIDSRSLTLRSLLATLGSNTVGASGHYTWSGQIDGRFDATADDVKAVALLAGLNELPVGGAARLTGEVAGTLGALRGRATLTSRDVSAYDVAAGQVAVDIRLGEDRIEVDADAPDLHARLRGSIGMSEPYRFQGEVALDRASIPAILPPSARTRTSAEGTVTATIRGEGNLTRPLESVGEIALSALDATMAGTPILLESPGAIGVTSNAFTVTPLQVRIGANTAVTFQGALGLDDVGSGLDVRVEGPLSNLLELAEPLLPEMAVETEGSQVVVALHVGGTLVAPEPSGTLALTASAVRYGAQPPFTNVALEARIERTGIAFQSLTANWLGAGFNVEGVLPLRLIVPQAAASDTSPGPRVDRSTPAATTSGMAAWGSAWLVSVRNDARPASLLARMTGATTELLSAFVDPSKLEGLTAAVAATLAAEADSFALDGVRGSLVFDDASFAVADVPFAQSVPPGCASNTGEFESKSCSGPPTATNCASQAARTWPGHRQCSTWRSRALSTCVSSARSSAG